MPIKNVYKYKNIIEIERHHAGRYGKGTCPGVRKALTPAEMEKINEKNCIKKLRRKIQASFNEGDLYITLTYKRALRPDAKEAKRRIKNMFSKLRRIWKKEGEPLKYIIVTEYLNTSIHHHMILNDLPDGSGAKKVNQVWKENGGTHNEYLYENGHYEQLAAYLIKETCKSFRSANNPSKTRYSCSRNLKTPRPKTTRLKRDNWPDDPKVPKGYYLEKDSLHNGYDKRGFRYQYYRLVKIGWKKQKKVTSTKGKKQTSTNAGRQQGKKKKSGRKRGI